MRRARADCFVLACVLAACAAPTAEEPKGAEVSAEAEAAAPLSPERQRLERWKEDAAVGDPRKGFARAAEAEAERRRSEALARAPEPRLQSLEAAMRAHELEELVTWTGGCFAEEPDFSAQGDWIRHRALTRNDFLETEPVDTKPVVEIPGSQVGAYVMVRLACVVRTRVVESGPGRFTAELVDVRFFSLLSRENSWWNPDARTHPEWILRHEQLHFDVGELFAEEQNGKVADVRQATREVRDDPEAAVRALNVHLAAYLDEQQKGFRAMETQYDRETRHGTDFARQTEWFARVKRGLAGLREP